MGHVTDDGGALSSWHVSKVGPVACASGKRRPIQRLGLLRNRVDLDRLGRTVAKMIALCSHNDDKFLRLYQRDKHKHHEAIFEPLSSHQS